MSGYEWTVDPALLGSTVAASAPRVLGSDVGLEERHMLWLRRRGLAEGTIRTRRYVLARLRVALAPVPPAEVGAEQVQQYLDDRRAGVLSGRPLGDGAYRCEVVHVREWFRWLVREGVRLDDPTGRVEFPRVPLGLPRPIPDAATRDVMTGALPDDRAILALARLAGLRACEVAGLAWSDVDLPGRLLFVRLGKGRKQREVPMPDELVDVLGALPHRTGPVVRRRDGHAAQCTPNMISKRGSALLGAAGTLHQLRHRYATALVQGTGDLRTTQELLGHSSPNVTQVYTLVGSVQARRAVDLAGMSV